jgi:uncharacterized protein YaiE (UPF0345 family)
MLKTNQYFEGKVASVAFANAEGNATVGVMDIGEYEFGTSTIEHMTVISGCLTVLLPGQTEWKNYHSGDKFIVPADAKFKLVVKEQTAYSCFYV